MGDDKLATFRIDGDTWQAFQDKAKTANTSASALLKGFVQQYLDGRIDIASSTQSGVLIRLDGIEAKLVELDQRLGKLNLA
ncbi:MAG TPA: hypothetical protein V6D29_06815 [Leptolyngbyaceae cyanobacterium]